MFVGREALDVRWLLGSPIECKFSRVGKAQRAHEPCVTTPTLWRFFRHENTAPRTTLFRVGTKDVPTLAGAVDPLPTVDLREKLTFP